MIWFSKKKLIFFIFLITILLIGWYTAHPLGTKLTVRGQTFDIELAVTEQEKQRGLGYRDSLAQNSGMLFIYDHAEQYGFWMKGMRFPLDIIWIKEDIIVDITNNIPNPINDSSQLLSFQPKVAVDKVLEVNAGTVNRLGIQVGDTVDINN